MAGSGRARTRAEEVSLATDGNEQDNQPRPAGETDDSAQNAPDQAASTGSSDGSASQDAGDSQRELAQLRAEVADLRKQLEQPPPQPSVAPQTQRRIGWRGPVATVLIVLGCLLTPLSVVAVWSSNQLSNTDRYVQNVTPLIKEPAVQQALTDKITTAISDQLDVQKITKQAASELSRRGLTGLSAILSSFSGSIASGVDGFIHSTVAKIVASPAVEQVWVQANRVAHTQLVKALNGQQSAISVSNGQVVIGLGPFIDQVKRKLAASGLTIVNSLPSINPTFPLFSDKYLVQAQSLYRLLNTLKWVLPIASVVLLAVGVYVDRRHRRALVGVGLGIAASMLVLGIGLIIGRTIYLDSVPNSVIPASAAATIFDTIVRFIKDSLRVLFVVGISIAVGAFFTGSSITAVTTRRALTAGFAAARKAGERVGITTGAFGSWVFRFHTALRAGTVAAAVVALVFWPQPTALATIVIALILLAATGLIELLGRPPSEPALAGVPAAGGDGSGGGTAAHGDGHGDRHPAAHGDGHAAGQGDGDRPARRDAGEPARSGSGGQARDGRGARS